MRNILKILSNKFLAFSFISCLSLSAAKHCNSQTTKIPFDSTNPVFYDNDDHRDVYTDEYLLSLASAGTIDLEGIVTTYSANKTEYDLFVNGRQQIIDKARRSGFINLPNAIAGPSITLKRPASNRVEDTKSLNSEAGRAIVKAAMKASSEKPLVIIAGGQLTAIADAYLQDSSIADRIIVSGIFGVRDKAYNAGLDAWAWSIVLLKFKCLSISDSNTDIQYNQVFKTACPQTPKKLFARGIKDGTLPDTEFYQWMLEKHHPTHPSFYMEQDADAPPAIPLVRPDYIKGIERWRCTEIDSDGMPKVVRDSSGPLYLVTHASRDIATHEFWRAIENAKAWQHNN